MNIYRFQSDTGKNSYWWWIYVTLYWQKIISTFIYLQDEPTQKKDSNADGHKSEESDNDEVFEDADLFSEIVTALSEV